MHLSTRSCSSNPPPFRDLRAGSRRTGTRRYSRHRSLCTSPPRSRPRFRTAVEVDKPVANTNGAARIRPKACTRTRPPLRRRAAQSASDSPAKRPRKTRQRPQGRSERRAVEPLAKRRETRTSAARSDKSPQRNSRRGTRRASSAAAGFRTIRPTLAQSDSSAQAPLVVVLRPVHPPRLRSRPDAGSISTTARNTAYASPARPSTQNGDRQPYRSPSLPPMYHPPAVPRYTLV